jgi:hypothetical protein
VKRRIVPRVQLAALLEDHFRRLTPQEENSRRRAFTRAASRLNADSARRSRDVTIVLTQRQARTMRAILDSTGEVTEVPGLAKECRQISAKIDQALRAHDANELVARMGAIAREEAANG